MTQFLKGGGSYRATKPSLSDGGSIELQVTKDGKLIVANTADLNVPSDYNGEDIKEWEGVGVVSFGAAAGSDSIVWVMPQPIETIGGSTLNDGTNQLCHTEIVITENDFVQPTGTQNSVVVQVFRTDDANGSATSGTILGTFGMDAQTVSRIPDIKSWGTEKFKMAIIRTGSAASGSARSFNISYRGLYYTPS